MQTLSVIAVCISRPSVLVLLFVHWRAEDSVLFYSILFKNVKKILCENAVRHIQVWIQLPFPHLLPVNHLCKVQKNALQRKTLEVIEHTACVSLCARTHTHTQACVHTLPLSVSQCGGVYVTGLMAPPANELLLEFFSAPPSAVILLISSRSYFKGAPLKPVSY